MTLSRTPVLATLLVLLAACADGESQATATAGSSATAQGGAGEPAGMVPDWTHGATQVWREGTDHTVGRIDANGQLWFHGHDARGSFGILERLVHCDSEGFEIENGEARYEPITLGIEHRADAWRLLAGSTPEAAQWQGGHGTTPQPGSSTLQWVHVDGAVRIHGECSTHIAAGDANQGIEQRTEFALALHPGWNLLRHTFVDVDTGADGRPYVAHIRVDSPDAMPASVTWHIDES